MQSSSLLVPAAPPANFILSNVTTNSALLSWDPPAYEQQNGMIRHYVIFLTELSGTDNIQEIESFATSSILEDLRPAFCYSVSVAAYTIGVGPTTTDAEFCLLTAGMYMRCSEFLCLLHLWYLTISPQCTSTVCEWLSCQSYHILPGVVTSCFP